jgi:hypothetical protein
MPTTGSRKAASAALITEGYLDLNKELHAHGRYGRWGDMWLEEVTALIARFNPATVLDYGCGQGALARGLGPLIAEYDPAVEGKDELPEPADLVICTDVLEHIEPECLDAVLDHLRAVTRAALFAVISTRPAVKTLSDGRNAHLIIQPWSWWERKLTLRFDVIEVSADEAEARVLLKPTSRLRSMLRRLFVGA